jgi:ribonucleoside-diphosphate reductase alpha chain
MINVTKRDGSIVPIDLDKIHNMLEWACEGLKKVSVSDIEMNAKLQFNNKIKTSDIHSILIKSAVDLISERTPDYEYVASKLLLVDLRKKVYGQFEPISFTQSFYKNIEDGKYDKDILSKYTEAELKSLDKVIKYDRDYTFTYAGLRQVVDKYLVQNRKTKKLFELPQEMFMSIGVYMFQNYPVDTRLSYIKKFYDLISTHKISLPTPIISGVRTNRKQFASCCLIDVGDTTNSLVASKSAVALYTTLASGIGLNFGRIRGIDAEVKDGDIIHTGVVPFLKSYDATTKEWTQNGLRGGSASCNFPFFTWEIEKIVHLKSTKTTEDNQVRGMDYVVQIDDFFLEKAMNKDDITLFSMEETKDLYEAFYSDGDLFRELYTKYENKRGIRKKKINAYQLLEDILTERFETGRIYITFTNNVRAQKAQKASIYMTNLCSEIMLTTKPIMSLDDDQGRIATCILSCVNLGKIDTDKELEDACDIMVRFLDELIDYQTYPVTGAELSTKRERNLGIGISDYFHYLAKNKARYNSEEGRKLTHEIMEKFQYNLILASCNLAKEKGPCEDYKNSKYSDGILPIDRYSKAVDSIVSPEYVCDWESLRADLIKYGIRHSVISAIPPTASSSLVSNSTPGIDAPRSLLTVKVSKKGTVKQLVPDFTKLSQYYTTAWELDNIEYFKVIAIMQ